MQQTNTMIIRYPDGSDFVFSGELLADVFDPSAAQEEPCEFDCVWTRLRLFRVSENKQYICVAEDFRDLRRVQRKIATLANEAEVIDFFGHSELAKTLYRVADIDENADPPNPQPEPKPDPTQDRETQAVSEGPSFPIYDEVALQERIESVRKQGNRRQLAALERLAQTERLRALTTVEHEHLARLDGLGGRFPNFADVVQALRRQLALCLLSPDRALHLPALLLYGPPGIGKTRFIQQLAQLLEAEFEIVACNTTTAGFVIAGNDPSWNDSKPGRIFEILCRGLTANPVVMLDEIDKMRGEGRYDPYGPLFSLLEPATACGFVDECLTLELDCSRIIFVATANENRAIPEPILSRFTGIEVLPPRSEDMPRIAESVYRDVRESEMWAKAFARSLPDETLSRLASLTPRLLRATLRDAMGIVAARALESQQLEPDTIPLQVEAKDVEAAMRKSTARHIGFV